MPKKEAMLLNSRKRHKEVVKFGSKDSKKPAAVEPVVAEVIEEPKVETAPKKVGFGEKFKNLFERKIGGAITELFRRKELDETIEKNLSGDLESNSEFAVKSEKINKKRNWFISKFDNLLNKKVKEETAATPYVFDDAAKQAMKELEEELPNSFVKSVYNKMADTNKQLLLDHLVDNPVNQNKSEIIELPSVSEANDNVVAFSDNGYLMQLTNKEEVRQDSHIDTEHEKALYNLISPDGKIVAQQLNYVLASEELKKQANAYQETLKEEFAQQEIIQKNILEREKENNSVVTEGVSEKEEALNKLMEQMESNEREIALDKEKENEFFENFGKEELIGQTENILVEPNPSLKSYYRNFINKDGKNETWISQNTNNPDLLIFKVVVEPNDVRQNYYDGWKLLNKEEFNSLFEEAKETVNVNNQSEKNEATVGNVNEVESNLDSSVENNFKSPFNENISRYAENIGIKSEELAANKEFLALSPEQQQFALETLRRSSLAKAKVEGYQSFMEEKASKKWWQIGFGMNQNYHKERHKVEAVQNIESRGLEGYGETELAWLVDVIKSGPEVKINKAGEIIVNCLHEDTFSDEQKELVAKYNETARKYIEHKSKDSNSRELLRELDDIKGVLLNSTDDFNKAVEINSLLLKSKNNIELLKFLSADKETEKLLNKMSETSFSGVSKFTAMAGAQKDKFGYATLGFALRVGTKFALPNATYLAGAVSYSIGPMVAAFIGGFRGLNMGKKEILEKEELAKLGVIESGESRKTDAQKGTLLSKTLDLATGRKEGITVKAMNLATGVKEGTNFGLTEKLQNLVDKLNFLNDDSEYREEDIEKIKKELNLRINYTETQINREEVNYGSIEERNANYFNLLNTLAESKSVVGRSAVHKKLEKYWVSGGNEKLTRGKTIDLKELGLEKKDDETDEVYKERLAQNKDFVKYQKWMTDENKLEELSKLSVSDRLASFMNYREDKQNKKELSFLLKKTLRGAVMGATFATTGVFLADKLGVTDWFHVQSEKLGVDTWLHNHFGFGKNAEGAVAPSAKVNIETSVNDNVAGPVATTSAVEAPVAIAHEVPVSHVEAAPITKIHVEPASRMDMPLETIKAKPINLDIKTPNQSGEIIAEHQVVTSETPANITETPSHITETVPVENTPTNTVVETSNQIPKVPVEAAPAVPEAQEVVDGRNVAGLYRNLMDANNQAAKVADGLYSNKPEFRTEDGFLKQIENSIGGNKLSPNEELEAKGIYESFKNNHDYNILRRRLVSFENGIVSEHQVSPVEATSSATNNVVEAQNAAAPTQADTPAEVSNEVPANTVVETPSQTPVAPVEAAPITPISHEPINGGVAVETPANAPAVHESPEAVNDTQYGKLASIEDIAKKDLHVKPESLSKIGDDLVYKGAGKSTIIFSKGVTMTEIVDVNGKKIPTKFAAELIHGKRYMDFTRNGGLDKIFAAWNKLGANDKLIYESMDWFKKGTFDSPGLIKQIQGVYQANMDTISIEKVNGISHFVSGDGRKFDMTLKGIKKMIAFLPHK